MAEKKRQMATPSQRADLALRRISHVEAELKKFADTISQTGCAQHDASIEEISIMLDRMQDNCCNKEYVNDQIRAHQCKCDSVSGKDFKDHTKTCQQRYGALKSELYHIDSKVSGIIAGGIFLSLLCIRYVLLS